MIILQIGDYHVWLLCRSVVCCLDLSESGDMTRYVRRCKDRGVRGRSHGGRHLPDQPELRGLSHGLIQSAVHVRHWLLAQHHAHSICPACRVCVSADQCPAIASEHSRLQPIAQCWVAIPACCCNVILPSQPPSNLLSDQPKCFQLKTLNYTVISHLTG